MINGIENTFGDDTEGESNIVVLIGDCGAIEYDKYNREKVIEELINKKLSLVSYQCNFKTNLEGNKNPLALTKDIILYTRKLGEEYFDSEKNEGFAIDINGNEGVLRSKIITKNYIYPIFAAYKSANSSNATIEPSELRDHVTETINDFIKIKEDRAQILRESINIDVDPEGEIATERKKTGDDRLMERFRF